MNSIHTSYALLKDGWAENVLVKISDNGRISEVSKNNNNKADKKVGILLPSPVNVHSHSFQRAMAGLTEHKGRKSFDSFWTWRDLMFKFLDQLQPYQIESISAFVQMEMLEAGFSTNVEFHYLHHQSSGIPYDNLSELADRIASSASATGIGLTLLPVYYQYGGCGKTELTRGQIRFGNDIDRFINLAEKCAYSSKLVSYDSNSGIAAHSLRAVTLDGLNEVIKLSEQKPFHMHLAEQKAEVEEVFNFFGKRPIDLVLDNFEINPNWCLIHCTQMNAREAFSLAKTGAVAGLCPITESSLGDGIFDGVKWLKNNGSIAIGSDSNIKISLSEEIRTLEYSQRLRDNSRASLASKEKSSGRRIFDEMLSGGAKASNRETGSIEVGNWADLMVLDEENVDISQVRGDKIIDKFVFVSSSNLVTDVWSAGRHVVKEGKHIHREKIIRNYKKTIQSLGSII